MPFTVVVVLHDSAAELDVLLRSIDARLASRPQVVVVDTGSDDGGASLAANWGADVLERRENPGFGAANDAGVELARHDVTVLLNPDCELLDDAIARLAALARDRPRALHAPRLLNADGSVQRSAHPLPGTLGAVAGAVVPAAALPPPLRDRLEPHRTSRARSVGWTTAACLAGDTATLRRLGPFDPRVHLFGEDLDLCLRARAAGVPTVLHPELRVRHTGGHATLRGGEPYALIAARRRAVIGALRGRRALALDDLAQGLTFSSRTLAHALLGGDARRPWRQLRALAGARRARGGDALTGARRVGRGPPRRDGAVSAGRPVLLVAFAGVLGGAERLLLDWAGAIERPVRLACPPGPLAEAAIRAGLALTPLPPRPLRRRGRGGRAALDLAALARDVARLVRRERPAVVVASGQRPLLAAAAVPRLGARLLALQHDLPGHPALGLALRAAAARSDAVVVTAASVGRAVASRRHPSPPVIHPGVDAAAWRLPDPPPGPPRALVAGALVAVKRPDLALEIAARVPELSLDLAGAPMPGDDPALLAALHARAARPDLAGRVRFLGPLDDLRPALAAAHCLLHCGDREAFGLVLVEALAAGRPVVAPAAGGPLEIVTPACGRLFAPGDADAGAAALRAVLADPGLAAGARARAGDFDGAAAARRFGAVVEALTAAAEPPRRRGTMRRRSGRVL